MLFRDRLCTGRPGFQTDFVRAVIVLINFLLDVNVSTRVIVSNARDWLRSLIGSQRYRREQTDGQDQRQQQGYDSFHHFFFSPYVWFNFFVFFFRFSMCNGRGAGV